MKNRLTVIAGGMIVAVFLSGCSVRQASTIKRKHDPQTLAFGQDRAFVISQLAQPEETRTVNNETIDVYRMSKNSPGWGYTRAAGYGVANVATFGLWELIGTPLEEFVQSDQLVTINYDQDDKIQKVEYNR